MALYLDNTVDPIAAAGGRELNYIPKHFHCIPIGPSYFDQKAIRNWIWKNQSGRFAITTRTKVVGTYLTGELVAAFEDSGEAIMFSFILPSLSSTDFDLFS